MRLLTSTILAIAVVLSATPTAYAAFPAPDTTYSRTTPPWFTPQWVKFAAGIVAGEAADSDTARLLVTCTIRHDIERGWHPWKLRARWFGWRTPSPPDYLAVTRAFLTDACNPIPVCRFVGNWKDYYYWSATGLATSPPALTITDHNGATTLCVR